MIWRARERLLTFERQAQLMAVLNITPDSFSDGGSFFQADRAIDRAGQLVSQGAAILDIGGESTRPGSDPVPLEEELRRVIPVIRYIHREFPNTVLSIDTYKAETARQAIAAGADIINDITGLRGDPQMVKVVKETGAGVVLMHMQGTPQTMQINPCYKDVVQEVHEFFQDRIQKLKDCGVNRDQLILDPGLGFGKTVEHNLELLARPHSFRSLERPLLLGVSRKSFIGKVLGTKLADRLPAALACASLAVESGVELIRAHDVSETLQAVRMIEAIVKLR